MATPRPRTNKCAWALLVCDASVPEWLGVLHLTLLQSCSFTLVMNAKCGTRCSSQIVIRFRSRLCLWNGKLGFEALLSFVPSIMALIFDRALAPGYMLGAMENNPAFLYGGVNLSIVFFLSPPEAVSANPVVQSSSPVH